MKKYGTFLARGRSPIKIKCSIKDDIIVSLSKPRNSGKLPYVVSFVGDSAFLSCSPKDRSTYNYTIISNAA